MEACAQTERWHVQRTGAQRDALDVAFGQSVADRIDGIECELAVAVLVEARQQLSRLVEGGVEAGDAAQRGAQLAVAQLAALVVVSCPPLLLFLFFDVLPIEDWFPTSSIIFFKPKI